MLVSGSVVQLTVLLEQPLTLNHWQTLCYPGGVLSFGVRAVYSWKAAHRAFTLLAENEFRDSGVNGKHSGFWWLRVSGLGFPPLSCVR